MSQILGPDGRPPSQMIVTTDAVLNLVSRIAAALIARGDYMIYEESEKERLARDAAAIGQKVFNAVFVK